MICFQELAYVTNNKTPLFKPTHQIEFAGLIINMSLFKYVTLINTFTNSVKIVKNNKRAVRIVTIFFKNNFRAKRITWFTFIKKQCTISRNFK